MIQEHGFSKTKLIPWEEDHHPENGEKAELGDNSKPHDSDNLGNAEDRKLLTVLVKGGTLVVQDLSVRYLFIKCNAFVTVENCSLNYFFIT